MTVLSTPFYHFLFQKKPSRCFWTWPGNVGCCPHAEAQHGLGGAWNMTVSAAGLDSRVSQHIHMLNPGLPVFCSAAPTLVPMKVRSTRWWDEASKALLSGHLAGFLVRARKFIYFHAFLLAYVCMRHAPRRSWASRALRNDVRALVHFYTPLHYWRWVCDGWSCASQLHCAGSVAANHASTRLRIMWLRALRWCFSSTMVTGDVSWALLDFVGGAACDVCRCASQLHCAGSIAANHACTRLHIHAISYFKVTFSCSLLIIQVLRWPFLGTFRGDVCDVWRGGSQLRCAGCITTNRSRTRLRAHDIKPWPNL